MQKRRLGRTDLWVSIMGFGAAVIRSIPRVEAEKVLVRALDSGVNYFDTAPSYGDSEAKIGALSKRRDEFYIATKIDPPFTRQAAEASIAQSLRRLKTDRIDLVQLHGIGDEETLTAAMGPNGAMEAIKDAQARGVVDYVGITSHDPAFLGRVITGTAFDMVLAPFNALYQDAATHLFDRAKTRDIGVAIMKPFACGALTKSIPETAHLFKGKDVVTLATNALRFILDYDVATIIPGTSSLREVDVNVAAAETFTSLTRGEAAELAAFCNEVGQYYCRGGIGSPCERCMPCPEGIPIQRIFGRYYRARIRRDPLEEYLAQFTDYYRDLPTKVAQCTECGECETRCPYKLPIIDLLKKVDAFYQTSK